LVQIGALIGPAIGALVRQISKGTSETEQLVGAALSLFFLQTTLFE